MSHCEHCHSKLHQHFFSVKRVGFWGAVIMVLHLAFHLVEFLIFPAILVGLGSHATEEPAVAINLELDTSEPSTASMPAIPRLFIPGNLHDNLLERPSL